MKYLSFKDFNLIILILFLSFKGNSQNSVAVSNRSMESFVSSGSNATGSSGSISYSVGQLFYTNLETSNINIAAGIQQAEVKKTLSIKSKIVQSNTEITVFPNPAKDFIYLIVTEDDVKEELMTYKLFNLQSMLLKESTINQEENKIDLNDLKPSFYLLQVYRNNKCIKTFKIIKK